MWPVLKRPANTATPRIAPHRRFLPRRGLAADTGLYPDEPPTCRRDLRQFLPIWTHLSVLLAVVHIYRVEGRAFEILVALAAGTLPVHYLLPLRWKKPFFVGVSLGGLVAVFGLEMIWTVLPVAAVLIGVCFLPLAWWFRAGLIAALAAALALARAGWWVPLDVPATVWPVLGTMFMFRMIVFLYELKHAEKPEKPIDALSYFFLLPNYCFLHFPVVDYRTFLRGYFAADIHAIQRRGLVMMTRGTVHLLLYRLVYHNLLIAPGAVRDPLHLLQFVVCNYFLYLRVSGQFHMACGMLHLFGFQLPETHHHYFLATGFTDYWRRINIYWKDFMIRVVFNPVVFRLKRRPRGLALAVATLAVFVTTWALHAYQAFWLRGRWGFSVPDALFWGVLGALVLINVQIDARAVRRVKGADRTARGRIVRALKVAGTFTTLALLWSLWSSSSVGAWVGMFRRAIP